MPENCFRVSVADWCYAPRTPQLFSLAQNNIGSSVMDRSPLEHFRFRCSRITKLIVAFPVEQISTGLGRTNRGQRAGVNAAFPLRKAALQETEWDIAIEIRSKKSHTSRFFAVSTRSEML
jgi:hypothetical protein